MSRGTVCSILLLCLLITLSGCSGGSTEESSTLEISEEFSILDENIVPDINIDKEVSTALGDSTEKGSRLTELRGLLTSGDFEIEYSEMDSKDTLELKSDIVYSNSLGAKLMVVSNNGEERGILNSEDGSYLIDDDTLYKQYTDSNLLGYDILASIQTILGNGLKLVSTDTELKDGVKYDIETYVKESTLENSGDTIIYYVYWFDGGKLKRIEERYEKPSDTSKTQRTLVFSKFDTFLSDSVNERLNATSSYYELSSISAEEHYMNGGK